MKQLAAMRRYDASTRLRELSGVRTMVVSARYDRIAQADLGRALAQGIPGARYVELPDAAHGIPVERPDVINKLLLEHLAHAERSTPGEQEPPRPV